VVHKRRGVHRGRIVDSEGWFHTGDYGYLDENCNVFVMDRIKELLKVGDGYGTHISAAEREAVVFQHAAVASAVVVGILGNPNY
jgi:acyl-CoA synthetase (AMP-forming)/AMP-acid ligase II